MRTRFVVEPRRKTHRGESVHIIIMVIIRALFRVGGTGWIRPEDTLARAWTQSCAARRRRALHAAVRKHCTGVFDDKGWLYLKCKQNKNRDGRFLQTLPPPKKKDYTNRLIHFYIQTILYRCFTVIIINI